MESKLYCLASAPKAYPFLFFFLSFFFLNRFSFIYFAMPLFALFISVKGIGWIPSPQLHGGADWTEIFIRHHIVTLSMLLIHLFLEREMTGAGWLVNDPDLQLRGEPTFLSL